MNDSKNWFACTPCRRHDNETSSEFPGDVTSSSSAEIHLRVRPADDAAAEADIRQMTSNNARSFVYTLHTALSNNSIGKQSQSNMEGAP